MNIIPALIASYTIVFLVSMLLMIGYIITSQDSHVYKYLIIQDRTRWVIDSYTKTPDGCIHFIATNHGVKDKEETVICGSYSVMPWNKVAYE